MTRPALLSLLLVACAHDQLGRSHLAEPAITEARLAPGDYDIVLPFGGEDRYYIVHVPPQAARGAPLPVLVNLHGGGGNAENQKSYTRQEPLADREGIVLVFPGGSKGLGRRLLTWNASTCCGPAMKAQVDDVGFILAVLDDVAGRVPVDATRVYATGHSNGAMMAYRLAAEAGEHFAAIAPVAGARLVELHPARPMPIIHFHSTDDPRALYKGGVGPAFFGKGPGILHPAVDGTIASWVTANGCTPEPARGDERHGAAGHDATHTATPITWTGCAGGAEIVLWKLSGSGHTWPGVPPNLSEKLVGAPTQIVDANELMWAFLSRFHRADAPPLGRESPIGLAVPLASTAEAERLESIEALVALPLSGGSIGIASDATAAGDAPELGGRYQQRGLTATVDWTLWARAGLRHDRIALRGLLVHARAGEWQPALDAIGDRRQIVRTDVGLVWADLATAGGGYLVAAGMAWSGEPSAARWRQVTPYLIALGEWRPHRWALIYGGAIGTMLGRLLAIPGLGVEGPITRKVHLEVLLPVTVAVTWKVTPGLALGVEVASAGETWHANDASAPDASEVVNVGALQVRTGLRARLRMAHGWRFELAFGVLSPRKLELRAGELGDPFATSSVAGAGYLHVAVSRSFFALGR